MGLIKSCRTVLRRGVVVKASDLQPIASQVQVPAAPLHVTTLGKLFTHTLPVLTKQYKLVPGRRKLGAKQALHSTHWPRVRGLAASPVVSG